MCIGNTWVIISKEGECMTWGGIVRAKRNERLKRLAKKVDTGENKKEHRQQRRILRYGIAHKSGLVVDGTHAY